MIILLKFLQHRKIKKVHISCQHVDFWQDNYQLRCSVATLTNQSI